MHLKQMLPYQLKQAVKDNLPLLVPAGCIETHGPHMAIGHDTLIVEEICSRIAEKSLTSEATIGEQFCPLALDF